MATKKLSAAQEMGRRRMAPLSQEEVRALGRKGGQTRWRNLTAEQREALVTRLRTHLAKARKKRWPTATG